VGAVEVVSFDLVFDLVAIDCQRIVPHLQ
jgi:hypothetical protein